MMIATGTKLGRYEIRSKIGEGGMGEVYLAEDTRLQRKVGLKVLRSRVQPGSNASVPPARVDDAKYEKS